MRGGDANRSIRGGVGGVGSRPCCFRPGTRLPPQAPRGTGSRPLRRACPSVTRPNFRKLNEPRRHRRQPRTVSPRTAHQCRSRGRAGGARTREILPRFQAVKFVIRTNCAGPGRRDRESPQDGPGRQARSRLGPMRLSRTGRSAPRSVSGCGYNLPGVLKENPSFAERGQARSGWLTTSIIKQGWGRYCQEAGSDEGLREVHSRAADRPVRSRARPGCTREGVEARSSESSRISVRKASDDTRTLGVMSAESFLPGGT